MHFIIAQWFGAPRRPRSWNIYFIAASTLWLCLSLHKPLEKQTLSARVFFLRSRAPHLIINLAYIWRAHTWLAKKKLIAFMTTHRPPKDKPTSHTQSAQLCCVNKKCIQVTKIPNKGRVRNKIKLLYYWIMAQIQKWFIILNLNRHKNTPCIYNR